MENRILLTNNSGAALFLDGADDYATVSDNTTLDLGVGANDDFTIELSFYLNNSPLRRAITLADKAGAFSLHLITNDFNGFENISFELGQPGGSTFIFAASSLSTGWHHIAAVFDNEVTTTTDFLAFYVDGVLRNSNNSDFQSVPNTTTDFRIGDLADTLTNGYVDEIRLSDTARYSGASFSVPTAPFSSDANTRALWHFDEAVGSTAFTDTSPNGNTLTGVNGAQTTNPPGGAPIITSDGGGATATRNVAENTMAVTTVTATDADLPPQTLTYSISGGADSAKFTIGSATGVLTFVSAPNYEAPTDAGANNVYDVTVQVSDGTLTDTQTIAVTVTDINETPPSDYNVNGAVDAADFVLWRKTEGSMVAPFSGADGSGNGTVDQADYGIWRANFGNTSPPPGSGSVATLPVTVVDPIVPKATTEAAASEQEMMVPTQRSGASRRLRSSLPLVTTSHDDALVEWLANRREWPRHDESILDFPELETVQVSGSALSQLDNVLNAVFASLSS